MFMDEVALQIVVESCNTGYSNYTVRFNIFNTLSSYWNVEYGISVKPRTI